MAERQAFTPDELADVLGATRDEDRLLFDTLAETGVRWGEVCELRGQDLKTTTRGPRLAVRRAYSDKARDENGQRVGVVKWPKSTFARREIPLTPELARRLWRLQRRPGDLLFTSPDGGRMDYANTRRRVLLPLLKTAGVDWTAGFHTFRHTCASLLFAQGRNIKQVQRWLGHHKASFTLDTYVHLFGDDDDGGPLVLPVNAPGGTRGAPKSPETTQDDAKTADAY